MATPAALWVAVLLFVPVAFMLAYSVNAIALFPGDDLGFTGEYWQSLFSAESPYLRSFLTSLTIASLVSIICVVLAYPLAYYLALVVQRRRYILLVVLLAPFLTSYLLRVLAWRTLLSDGGVFQSLVQDLGLRPDGDPIPGLMFSRFAVILVLVYGWLPFAALPIFAVLVGQQRSLIEAAVDLGCSRLTAFRLVTLRLSLPGVIAALIMIFIPTLGEFVTPTLVGGVSTYLYGNGVASLFGPNLDWKTGSVLALFLFAVALLGMTVLARTRLAKDLDA